MCSLQAIKRLLLSRNRYLTHELRRNYRFGNRVTRTGFYYSPTLTANEKYLKRTDVEFDSEELKSNRNKLFDNEKLRQSQLITRVEKIEVQVMEPLPTSETLTLFMNRNMSTPYHCAQHIHEMLTQRSVYAFVDDTHCWDMSRSLTNDCKLQFRHFRESDTYMANKIFWRSCSFLLGMVIERAFKSDITVTLHSWPKPDINSGSFVYDVLISLNNWSPKEEELNVFTSMLWKISSKDYFFERLDVNLELAQQIFEHNKFKSEQVKAIADKYDKITLYRVDDHIDISCGPMISRTSQVGSIFVTAIHPIQTGLGLMYRFQGIGIPKQLNLNSFSYSVLRNRAKKLNSSQLPQKVSDIKNSSVKSEQQIELNNENDREVAQKYM